MGHTNVELTDLKTTSPAVKSAYDLCISSLVSTYSIDGFSIDSVRNVNQDFFPNFVSSAGVHAVCEIFNSNTSCVCPYQFYVPGVLSYPLYCSLTSAFGSTSGSMTDLASTTSSLRSSCNDTTLLGTFLKNHDNPRLPSPNADMDAAQNAIGMAILTDGIPIVYDG